MVIRRNPDGAIVILGGAALAALIVAILAARPARAAPEDETGQKLDYLADLAEAQVQQLQRLVEIGEGLTMPELVLPPDVTLTLKFPESIVTLPPDPEILAGAVQFMGEVGRFSVPTWRTALACPAGLTTTLPLNIPPGWVTFRRKPAELSSDFYDPNIGVNIYSDGVLINPMAPMPLTGAFAVDMGEYIAQWTQLTIEVINGTATDAVVSVHIAIYLMDRSFWDEFIVPGMDTVKEKIIRLIKG